MKKSKPHTKEPKGLTDAELVVKYDKGAIDLKTPVKKLLKTPSNSAILKNKKKG
jgi:hypothetical protein